MLGWFLERFASAKETKEKIPAKMNVLRRWLLGIGLLYKFLHLLFRTIPVEERDIALVLFGNGSFLPLRQFSVISLLHVLEFGR